MAPHSSTLAWKIPWTEEPGRLQSMGSLRVGHDWVTSLSLFPFMHWRRKRQPTPVSLPGESRGWGSLVGCHLWALHRVGHDWSDLVAAAAGYMYMYCWVICCSSKTIKTLLIGYSVQFSRSVVSDSLWPHESQHARPPCPSPSPQVHSNSRPSSRWCHPAISSSLVPSSSCLQSLPTSESFPMSQVFSWGGQSTGVSVLASLLPKNTQGWSPLEWTGWISL